MPKRRSAVFVAFATITTMAHAAESPKVTPPTAAPAVFARGEWVVDVGRIYDNPYDPAEIAVDAEFVDATGREMVMPAFWREAAGGKAGAFVVRFAPDKPGLWAVRVDIVDASGKRSAAAPSFDAVANASPGLLRVAANRRYFRHDDGSTYFPIGINLCWPPGDERADWYDKQFATMADNGANFARVWMAHGPVQLESDRTGLGRYDPTNSAYYEGILESAERHGVSVMLCMLNHRDFLDKDMWGPAGWPTNPYNAKNGGPATRPADFFAGEGAKTKFDARLRYLIARYSSYRALGFWELVNEQEFTPTPVPPKWDADVAAYLTAHDPYRRMVTTSAHVPEAVWKNDDMAVTQAHLYGDGRQADLVPATTSSVADHAKYDKPHLIAEAGIDSAGPDTKFDPDGHGTAFHNSLWAAALGGSAGSTMYWWWDNYVGPKNLWHEFKPLADFVKPIDFAGKSFAPLMIPELRHAQASGRGDLTLPAAGGWGTTMNGPLAVPPNGRPGKAIMTYVCGPSHKSEYSPIELDVDLPAESKLTINASRVSDYALLRVSVDGKPVGEMLFTATPGGEGIGETKYDEEGHGYRASVTAPRTLPAAIPAGRHRVTIDAVAGDWVTFSGVSFADALDNHYADLGVIAVQDAASNETLAWVFDPRSTWKTDQNDPTRKPTSGVSMIVPNVTAGEWTTLWWDTRAGKPIRSERVTAKDGHLKLDVPRFTRDVALRLTPAE